MRLLSSWSQRQSKDAYVKMAKKDEYRARSAYKLLEIWKQFPPPPSSRSKSIKILDLGSAPGSWTQVAQRTYGSKTVSITGIDLQAMHPIPDTTFIQRDFRLFETEEMYDIVMSDMAPQLTGIGVMDYENSFNLVLDVISFAKGHLRIGGMFIMKHFFGPKDHLLIDEISAKFEKVKFFIPKSTRSTSSERYLVGHRFR